MILEYISTYYISSYFYYSQMEISASAETFRLDINSTVFVFKICC